MIDVAKAYKTLEDHDRWPACEENLYDFCSHAYETFLGIPLFHRPLSYLRIFFSAGHEFHRRTPKFDYCRWNINKDDAVENQAF